MPLNCDCGAYVRFRKIPVHFSITGYRDELRPGLPTLGRAPLHGFAAGATAFFYVAGPGGALVGDAFRFFTPRPGPPPGRPPALRPCPPIQAATHGAPRARHPANLAMPAPAGPGLGPGLGPLRYAPAARLGSARSLVKRPPSPPRPMNGAKFITEAPK